MNILIQNAHVVTMDRWDRVLEGGSVAVADGRIAYVGPGQGLPAGFTPERTIDARGGVVLPGFVNAHTHLAMTLLRGYGSDLNLQDWLEQKIWPAEDRLVAGNCYWAALLGLAEMLKTGTTAFLDMYFFMDEVARAVDETGMRAVLSRGIVGVGPNFEQALTESQALYRDFHGAAGGRLRVMLAPHAEYTNNDTSIERIVEVAHKLNSGIHVHLQETVAETESCLTRHGVSPTLWLERKGLFDLHTVAAHCVTVTPEDEAILLAHDVSVAHNPGSNMKLASGLAPVERMRGRGINVALGTDGPSSNNNLNMLEEANLASLCAKIKEGDPTALPAYEALKMATIGGARALEIDDTTGSLEVGKAADIIMIEADSPAMRPMVDPVANVVYSAGSAEVSLTMVQGRILMERGELPGFDLERIYFETERISAGMRL